MNDLIRIIYERLASDEGPNLGDDDPAFLAEIAQNIAEAIVEAGWPRQEASS